MAEKAPKTEKPPKAVKPPKVPKEKKPREKRVAKRALTARFNLGLDSENKQYGKDNNPKRGTAAERFNLYRNNMTIQQALDAGLKQSDIAWDSKQGFIVFKDPEDVAKAA